MVSTGPSQTRRATTAGSPVRAAHLRGGHVPALLAVGFAFFLAHAAMLPATFADVDEVNFALGVRDFDVARHQPHPPGYPVFIAAAKGSTALLAALGVPSPEARGLAILSAAAGAVLPFLLWLLFRSVLRDRTAAAWAAVVAGMSPLFWFNALRPLSDLSGVAIVTLAQGLLAAVIGRAAGAPPSTYLLLGALLAGLSIGVRSQNFVLTLPLLAAALAWPRSGLTPRDRMLAVAAAVAAALSWGIPLLAASGGLEAYLAALGDQAGEDFSGVVMLWTARSPRVAMDAVAYSFLWPWGGLAAGAVVMALAAAGTARMLASGRVALAVLAIAFAPYAVFHLLFQETLTTRYALPLVIPVAVLAVHALDWGGRRVLHAGGVLLVVWSLALAVPPGWQYGRRPTPSSAAVLDAVERLDGETILAMHAVMLRAEHWYHGNASGRALRSPHGREIPALVERWREQPSLRVNFVADPRRSDLAMLDPRTRLVRREYRWGFPQLPLLGGVRPGEAVLLSLEPPGWMLGPGWATTAEIGGQTARAGAEPHRQPAIAWIRSRRGPATLVIGGRNLAPASGIPARISISAGRDVIDSFDVPPGYFFETRELPEGRLADAAAYLPLQVAVAASPQDAGVRVSLEQFDVQSPDVPMVGLAAGWYEPEYDPVGGRAWRWMSDRGTLWVRDVGRDVTLTFSAESPLRYFDEPPLVRVSAGGRTLAEFSPADDFTREVTIPADLLASGAPVTIQTDRSFMPDNGDPRALALRVYSVSIN